MVRFRFFSVEVDNIEDLVKYGYNKNKTDEEMKNSGFQPRQVLGRLLPHILEEQMKIEWNKMTSLMVVRHPLDRLVSLYNNKFIAKTDKTMFWLTDFIIKRYRGKDGGPTDTVMPEELIR